MVIVRQRRDLFAPIQHGMNRQELSVLVDPDLMGQVVHFQYTPSCPAGARTASRYLSSIVDACGQTTVHAQPGSNCQNAQILAVQLQNPQQFAFMFVFTA